MAGQGLLPTKLRPRLARARTLERDRLFVQLDACVTLPLTLVVGGAGAGKSTALASWLEQVGDRLDVAWLSLEPGDDAPLRFFAYLLAALRRVVPELRDPSELVHAPARTGEALDALLADELVIPLAERTRPLVLVLDDFHVIHDARIHAALAWLLDARPPALHLVLLTRTLPDAASGLPLARLRGRGELGELGELDLRFTVDEAARFYAEVMGLALAPERVVAIEARTEGWPVGAQLAALSLRRGAELPSGDDRRIADYLLAEVLGSLDAAQREFVLATAHCERFCAPLAAALLGDDAGEVQAGELLAGLERANVFVIPLDAHARWFRYHHLFCEFLRERGRERGDAWVAERHARAARWLATRELREEAFEHALASGDAELIVELFERWAVDTLAANHTGVVARWLAGMPAALRDERAALAFVAGWCEVLEGRLVRGAMLLDRADALLDVGPTSPVMRMVMGHMAPMLRIAIEQRAGRAEAALALAAAARAALPDLPVRELVLARGSFVLQEGQVHLEQGRLDEALARLDQAVELLRVEPRLVVVPLAHLAQAQRRLGQVDAAERSLRRALQHAERSGTLEHAGAGLAHLELAALALERGEPALALRECEAGLAHNRRLRDLTYLNWGSELLARIHAAMGAREDALAVLDEALEQLDETDMVVARERMQAQRRELLASARAGAPTRAPAAAQREGPDALTERELEVLAAIAQGLGNRDIAQRLFVSLGTIKTHVHRILAKLDVDNRTAAVRRARELGLIA